MTDRVPVRELSPRARGHAAFDRGELAAAIDAFRQSVAAGDADHSIHYMLGLAHKYRREWDACLQQNMTALALPDDDHEAACWNAAIAATALGRWEQARDLWRAAGVTLDAGTGPIEADFGTASFRLNAWGDGETVYGRRLDPARARLISVPFPESGFHFGDIVLNDGAKTGERRWGDSVVPVLNVLDRLQSSPFQTFVAWVECASQADVDALEGMSGAGIGAIENWTTGTVALCLQCSYGIAHDHPPGSSQAEPVAWPSEHRFGIAAQGWAAAEDLLVRWEDGGRSRWGRRLRIGSNRRRVQSLDLPACELQVPGEGWQWWSDSPLSESDTTA